MKAIRDRKSGVNTDVAFRVMSRTMVVSKGMLAVDPEGIEAISRGLSGAIPPGCMCATVASRRDASAEPIWHPFGMQTGARIRTGGVAALNPRLMAVIPFGMKRPIHARSGVTLTEVLMSLMIMSIGVVSVATLFPISTLRTFEANKNTNSTITRFTAEGLVDVSPPFVHNPDGSYPTGNPTATDTTPYNSNTFRGKNYLVDPLGWQTFNSDSPAASAPLLPASSSARDYFGNSVSTTINWPIPRRYTGASLFPYTAGTISAYPNPTSSPEVQNALVRASQLVTQPDNFKLVTESLVLTTGTTTAVMSVTMDGDADMTSIDPNLLTAAYPTVAYRAVIFDNDGTRSEVRPITSITLPGTVTWAAALPSHYDNGNIGRIRIEQSDEIYTWMLSVRKRPTGSASVDVVVFFKRSFKAEHEYAYGAAFRKYTLGPLDPLLSTTPGTTDVPGASSGPYIDDNLNGTNNDIGEIGFPQTDDLVNNRVLIDFSTMPAGSEPPRFKRGTFIYDTKNGLWYRIRDTERATAANVILVLDEAIKMNNTEDLDGSGTFNLVGENTNPTVTPAVIDQGGAIWNPTIVNVFPLEIKEP